MKIGPTQVPSHSYANSIKKKNIKKRKKTKRERESFVAFLYIYVYSTNVGFICLLGSRLASICNAMPLVYMSLFFSLFNILLV